MSSLGDPLSSEEMVGIEEEFFTLNTNIALIILQVLPELTTKVSPAHVFKLNVKLITLHF